MKKEVNYRDERRRKLKRKGRKKKTIEIMKEEIYYRDKESIDAMKEKGNRENKKEDGMLGTEIYVGNLEI